MRVTEAIMQVPEAKVEVPEAIMKAPKIKMQVIERYHANAESNADLPGIDFFQIEELETHLDNQMTKQAGAELGQAQLKLRLDFD